MFIWMELPPGTDATVLLERAVDEYRVAFSPGAAFAAAPDAGGDHCLRLCFVTLTPEKIREGVGRLARALAPASH
jgi:DNA-binding transcriptional MocR family regulator